MVFLHLDLVAEENNVFKSILFPSVKCPNLGKQMPFPSDRLKVNQYVFLDVYFPIKSFEQAFESTLNVDISLLHNSLVSNCLQRRSQKMADSLNPWEARAGIWRGYG